MGDIGPGLDQLVLRENLHDVLAAQSPPALARQAFEDPECWRGLWKSVVDLGWTALMGDDFDAIDLVMVLEECGAAMAPMPLLSSIALAAGVLEAAGLERALTEIANGAVATLAAQPTNRRLPVVPMIFGDQRVRGQAVGVPDLLRAEIIVMLAASADQILAAVVKPGAVNEIAGQTNPEAQILKLLDSQTLRRVWDLLAAAAGTSSAYNSNLLFERQDALAASIYGGTSEVQHNIIGERALGLPKG